MQGHVHTHTHTHTHTHAHIYRHVYTPVQRGPLSFWRRKLNGCAHIWACVQSRGLQVYLSIRHFHCSTTWQCAPTWSQIPCTTQEKREWSSRGSFQFRYMYLYKDSHKLYLKHNELTQRERFSLAKQFFTVFMRWGGSDRKKHVYHLWYMGSWPCR